MKSNDSTTQVGSTSQNKQLDFYYRAKKQYDNGAKPFTYELNIFSTQPKPKKFMILINKFIDIMKQGMKQQYSNEQQLKQNYWNQLEKFYSDSYEMMYITENSYEKKKNKLRLYFGLLLQNKKIFQIIKQIHQKLSYMYEDHRAKIQQLSTLFEPVEFLRDGQYNIMSEFINEYQKFEEKKKQEEKLRQKILEKQRKKQEELLQQKRKKQEEQKLQRQRQRQIEIQKEKEKEKEENQRLERERKIKQEKQAEEKKNKTNDNQTAGQQIQYIPTSYIPINKNEKKQRKQSFQRLPQNVDQDLHLPQQKVKRHQKNSQILYQEKFKDEFEVFSFKLKPDFSLQNIDKDHCHECNQPLKQGFYFFGGNQNQCQYTGYYYCNQHIAEERISIPWKAVEQFDMRGYPVSKKSYIEIKSYFDKPIIEIKNDAQVVKKSKVLYEFLVLKRQIHLMYDSICDLELIQPLLRKKLNYCIKPNLFSLKNLYDIYNGHEIPSLQRQYDILSKHFYRCEQCQKRKGYICPKCNDPVKIFAFELKETHGCSNCRKLFHRKCLINNKCDCLEDD